MISRNDPFGRTERPNYQTPSDEINFVRTVSYNYVPLIIKDQKTLKRLLKNNIIINQTTLNLTDHMIEALALGLNFVTSEPNCPSFDTPLQKWSKKIDCAIHFADPDTVLQSRTSTRRRGWITKYISSDWEPPRQSWRDTLSDWETIIVSKQAPDRARLTPKPIIDAIKKLASIRDIHILPADKGGNTVIWHTDDYDREAQRQLNDKQTYQEQTYDEFIEHLTFLRDQIVYLSDLLLQMGHITKAEHKAIGEQLINGSIGYYLAKPHKKMNELSKTFPGRPIVATCSSVIHLLDKYLTELTAPLLPRIPGSLRDTSDLINKLPKDAPFAQTKITTADVEGLYPSIPWKEGIEASVLFYRQNLPFLREHAITHGKLEPPSVALFAEILTLVISNSFISFKNRRFFLQKQGTAMGMCISVFFANAFMYATTRHLIENQPQNVHTFLRYIDDILIVSDETFDANAFFDGITTRHIRYTIEYPSERQSFLDTYVSVREGRIITSSYRKPTASGLFLNPNSNHPPHVFRGIPLAQFMRIRRICTLTEDFLIAAKRLKKDLTMSGYDKTIINEAYNKALTRPTPADPNGPPDMAEEPTETNLTRKHDIADSIKLIFPYDQAANLTIRNRDLQDTHEQITQHYLKEGADFAVNAIGDKRSTIVSSVGKPIGARFTKHIKKPSLSSKQNACSLLFS